MIHSKVHFALQQADFRATVPVNPWMAEKTSKASLQIRRNRTLRTTAEACQICGPDFDCLSVQCRDKLPENRERDGGLDPVRTSDQRQVTLKQATFVDPTDDDFIFIAEFLLPRVVLVSLKKVGRETRSQFTTRVQ
jgi:hypothetical protein